MVRTQIYLTEHERDRLKSLSRRSGRKQSELIREAVDRMIGESGALSRADALDRGFGIWRHAEGLLDFNAIRKSLDR